jgi:monoamine oxidase
LAAGATSRSVSRREFLQKSASAAALAGVFSVVPGCLAPRSTRPCKDAPRIVIVGGGMAGLNAAYTLKRAGLRSTIYEVSGRTGGRMWSGHDLLAPGLTTELGGEFLDSGHDDMFALVREFELPLLDMADDAGLGLVEDACFMGGRFHSEDEIIEAFRPVVGRLQTDFAGLGETIDYRNDGRAAALDRTTLAEYLRRLDGASFLRQLLEVAYVTEYGLDADQQSALNLLLLIGLDPTDGFAIFGESDERYKVRGGNQRIVDELADRLHGQVELEHRLASLRARGKGFTLNFERKGGGIRDVDADFVILTVPFSVLRGVELSIDLPPVKRRAIAELGYGTNAKVLVGFTTPVWRSKGFTGNILTDEAFQLGWDNSRLQGNVQAGFTFYSGGQAGRDAGTGTAGDQVSRLIPGLSAAFDGVPAAQNGRVERFHWPSYPHSRGSYACYKPGQWTSIRSCEAEPVGQLHFAGEHCSLDYQGFMNGAAETGRLAAQAVLIRAGVTSRTVGIHDSGGSMFLSSSRSRAASSKRS